MIYITGDVHAEPQRFIEDAFPEQEEMTKDDYVISHEGPASDVALLSGGYIQPDPLNMYLEEIRQKLDYRRWFFGHHHMDHQINTQDIILYEQIVRVH